MSGNWSFRGVWTSGTAYAINDVVSNNYAGNGLDSIVYITTSVIASSTNAPWTPGGVTDGWITFAGDSVTYPNEDPVTNGAYCSQIVVGGVAGAPPPTSANGTNRIYVINNDGNVYTDFTVGRLLVPGINSGLSPTAPATIPFITTVGTLDTFHLQISGGSATAPQSK